MPDMETKNRKINPNLLIAIQVCVLLLCFIFSTTGIAAEVVNIDQSANEQRGVFSQIMQGGQVEEKMREEQAQNTAVINGVTPDAVNDMQSKLPRFAGFIGKIKYGTHNTVSKNGEEIVTLIRSLTTNPEQKNASLQKLQNYAKAGNPEALNFIGYVLDNGLFGTPKNTPRAEEYFKSAATAGYQPALFNLALKSAYSRQGDESQTQAIDYIGRAFAVAPDNSARVCGFAAFLLFRHGDMNRATYYAGGCNSPLSALPVAISGTSMPLEKRIGMLRTSIGAGVNDAYYLIENLAKDAAQSDNQFLYCKYALLNHIRQEPKFNAPKFAEQCYDKFTREKNNPTLRTQALAGITSFALNEKSTLEAIQNSNHFHYARTVPYIPFNQQDVDLFEPLFARKP